MVPTWFLELHREEILVLDPKADWIVDAKPSAAAALHGLAAGLKAAFIDPPPATGETL